MAGGERPAPPLVSSSVDGRTGGWMTLTIIRGVCVIIGICYQSRNTRRSGTAGAEAAAAAAGQGRARPGQASQGTHTRGREWRALINYELALESCLEQTKATLCTLTRGGRQRPLITFPCTDFEYLYAALAARGTTGARAEVDTDGVVDESTERSGGARATDQERERDSRHVRRVRTARYE